MDILFENSSIENFSLQWESRKGLHKLEGVIPVTTLSPVWYILDFIFNIQIFKPEITLVMLRCNPMPEVIDSVSYSDKIYRFIIYE